MLPLVIPSEEGRRQAVLPVRFAQGGVAGHRVPRVRDVISVGELELLRRGQSPTVLPLVLCDTRPRNAGFARRRRRRVIPRIVIVRTLGLAR